MYGKKLTLVLLVSVVVSALLLAGCGSVLYAGEPVVEAGPVEELADVSAEVNPEQAVEAFYTWHIEHTGYDPEAGEFRNPLMDGSYREAPHLSPAFADALQAQAEGGMQASPIFCAQDVPTSVTVSEATIEGETASVLVETSFEGHSFTVMLEQSGSEWLITNVVCSP